MVKDQFPSHLCQEMRNLVSVLARDTCMTDRANGESVSGQQILQEKTFHGTDGHASLLDHAMSGKGNCASMWFSVPIENNKESNQGRTESRMLQLKTMFSCNDGGVNHIVKERGFTRDVIANNKGEPINGRNIYDRALTAIAVCKLAAKFAIEYCPNNKLPSGKSIEDYLLYVRQKMFVKLQGAKNNRSNAKKKDGLTEDDMPDSWMFNGWFVFVLFGPQGLSATGLSCLSDDGGNVPKVGRAAARAKEAETEKNRRETDAGATGPFHRGVSIQDKLSCATLAHSEMKENSKNVREHLFLANRNEENKLKSLQLCHDMLKTAESEKERDMLRKRKLDLLAGLEEIEMRKKRLELESDRLFALSLEQEQIKTHYTSVGNFQTVDSNSKSAKKTVPNEVSVDQGDVHSTMTSSQSQKSLFAETPLADRSNKILQALQRPSQDGCYQNSSQLEQQLQSDDEDEDEEDLLKDPFADKSGKTASSPVELLTGPDEEEEEAPAAAAVARPKCPVQNRLSGHSKDVMAQILQAQEQQRNGTYFGGPNFDAHDYYGARDKCE